MSTSSQASWFVCFFAATATFAAPVSAAPIVTSGCNGLQNDVVCQSVAVSATGLGSSKDIIAGTTSVDITRNILASVTGAGGSASASAGVFGSLGLAGRVSNINVSSLSSKVTIFSDESQNLTGSDAAASGSFIIDGGRLTLIAGEGSKLTYSISIQTQVFENHEDLVGEVPRDENGFVVGSFFAGGKLLVTSAGVQFTAGGTDIGVARDVRRATQFNIPLSLQTIDFGIIPAGRFLGITYEAEFEISAVGFAEAISFEFSDPLNLAGNDVVVFPQVTFTPLAVTDVSEPGTLVLAAIGLLAVLRWRRQRAQGQEPAKSTAQRDRPAG